MAAGFLWFITTLAASSNELVYSLGWVGAWLVQPLLFVVMLAFPTGRLTTRLDRGLVLAGWALIAIFYLPTALLVEEYPVPSPYAPCGLDCPANAFMVVDVEPAFVDAWLRPLRELLAVTIFAAVLVVLARRVTRASGLMRRTLAPVLAAAILLAVFFIAYFLIRRISAGSPVLTAVGWLYVLCIPGIAVGFVVGLLRSKLAAGSALQRLVVRLGDHPDPGELTAVLRDTMEDPTLELVYWVPGPGGDWVNADGVRVPAPDAGSKRSLTEVRDDDRLVAGLVHDAALNDQREFVEAAGSVALAALENQRLAAEVDASLRELSESRARIQAAADSERRRIERDLHDGAQQRLVALRVRLGLAGELMREDPAAGHRAPGRARSRGGGRARGGPGARARRLPVAARRLWALARPSAPSPAEASRPPRRGRGESAGTSPRWRAPCTSAVSRRSRTWPSTHPARARCRSPSRTTVSSASRCVTTARALRRKPCPAPASPTWTTDSPRSAASSSSARRRARVSQVTGRIPFPERVG